eukprot:scaffold120935_cov29-Tisochrysis_lutea.AAC.4
MRCRGDDGSSTAPDGRRSPPGTTIDRAEAPDAGGSERVLLMAVEGRALREPASQFCAATRSISLAPRALRARIGGMADTEDPGRDAPDNPPELVIGRQPPARMAGGLLDVVDLAVGILQVAPPRGPRRMQSLVGDPQQVSVLLDVHPEMCRHRLDLAHLGRWHARAECHAAPVLCFSHTARGTLRTLSRAQQVRKGERERRREKRRERGGGHQRALLTRRSKRQTAGAHWSGTGEFCCTLATIAVDRYENKSKRGDK